MKIEYIFDEFKDLYPSMVENVMNIFQHGPYGIIVKLKDGKVFEFYILDKTFRQLPASSEDMSDEERMKLFGDNLYRIMYRKGVSQEELSKEIGITQTMFSRYVTGKSSPSFYTVEKIIKYLDCSYEELTYDYWWKGETSDWWISKRVWYKFKKNDEIKKHYSSRTIQSNRYHSTVIKHIYITGKSKPNIYKAYAMAEYVGCSIDELMREPMEQK